MAVEKTNKGSIFGGIGLMLVGVLILSFQTAFVKIVVICAGVAAFIDGIYTLFAYREWKLAGFSSKLTLIKSILMMISGVTAVIIPLIAAETVVSVVVFVFAAMLLYSAAISIENAIVIKNIDKEIPRGHFYVEAVFSAVVAVIFFTDPSKILSAFVVVIGIAIAVAGLGFLIFGIANKKNKN